MRKTIEMLATLLGFVIVAWVVAAFNGADVGFFLAWAVIATVAAPVAALVGYLLFRTIRAYLHFLSKLERT